MALPLTGKRIVVTRAPHQEADLSAMLTARGALPLPYPCIDIASPCDPAVLDDALRAAAAGGFDWLVLTSQNTVLALSHRLAELGIAPVALAAARVAAVGPATAGAAEDLLGLKVALIPDKYVAEGLAGALLGAAGGRVLLPQSAIARPVLADELAGAGFDVTVVEAYRTVRGSGGADVPTLLARRQVDALTFTSSSTVGYFFERLAAEGGDPAHLDGVCVACIGPVTARTAYQHGLEAVIVPPEYTLEGLVAALETHFAPPEAPTIEE